MSKWINKDLFNKFVEQKKNEKDKPSGGLRRSELAWKNPERGTVDKAKVYTGRFLPDPKGQFYKKYYYHMFQIGDQWAFFLCPKTYHFEDYCPWCSISSKLWTGTKADKSAAYNYKRKEKFVANWYVINDPRDAEVEDDEKVSSTVKMYEFPSKVESKLKEQITDTTNGLGPLIFTPDKEGFDFIIKVTSTKKDRNGKVWPDYSLSEFSRKPHAIAESEKAIEAIMRSTIDLDDYIADMERDWEDVVDTLKQLMLWDMVSDEVSKSGGAPVNDIKGEDIPNFDSEKESSDPEPPFEPDDDNGKDELSDDDLLKELEDL